MDEAIIEHIKRKYYLLIGERTELIKITIGSAYPRNEIETMEIRGRDLVAGVPRIIEVVDEEIHEALMEPVHQLVESVRIALERTPPGTPGSDGGSMEELSAERRKGHQLSWLCSCGKKPIELKTLGCCRPCYDRRHQELADEMFDALGFKRRGARIDEAIR